MPFPIETPCNKKSRDQKKSRHLIRCPLPSSLSSLFLRAGWTSSFFLKRTKRLLTYAILADFWIIYWVLPSVFVLLFQNGVGMFQIGIMLVTFAQSCTLLKRMTLKKYYRCFYLKKKVWSSSRLMSETKASQSGHVQGGAARLKPGCVLARLSYFVSLAWMSWGGCLVQETVVWP